MKTAHPLRLRNDVFRLAVSFALPPSLAARRSPARRARATPARASSLGSAPRPESKATGWAAPAARRAAPEKRPSVLQPAPAPGVRRCPGASQLQQTPCPPRARAACMVSALERPHTSAPSCGPGGTELEPACAEPIARTGERPSECGGWRTLLGARRRCTRQARRRTL